MASVGGFSERRDARYRLAIFQRNDDAVFDFGDFGILEFPLRTIADLLRQSGRWKLCCTRMRWRISRLRSSTRAGNIAMESAASSPHAALPRQSNATRTQSEEIDLTDAISRLHRLKEFFDLVLAEVDEREGSARGAGERGFEVEAEAVVDGGDDFGGIDGAFGGIAAGRVALAD